jgi:DNA-binding response OmpR family regulator
MDVLLVESDAAPRDALATALRAARLRTVAVASGEDALAAAHEQAAPKVLVTGIALGAGMDGFELVRRVRGRWPAVAVVLTGEGAGALRGRVLGPRDRFLARPVAPDALLAAVRELSGAGPAPPRPLG